MRMLFYMMGKSSSGKDTIYKKLLEDKTIKLDPLIPFTTRPIRAGEKPGREYHFVTKEQFEDMKSAGQVVEYRVYNTVHGEWIYFTALDEMTKAADQDYIVIGTVESFVNTKNALPEERIIPIYIDLDDGERLLRALTRERNQQEPKYRELCRRYLADADDFSEEKLAQAGIEKSFYNDSLDRCIDEIKTYISNIRNEAY